MSTKISLKVSFNSDIRRLSLHKPSYVLLQKTLSKLFIIEEEQFVNNIQIKYKDNENDLITISTDDEFQEAISLLTQPPILHLILVHPNPQSPPPKVQKPSPPQSSKGCRGFGHHWFWQQLKCLFNEGTKESLEAARTLLLKQLSIIPNHPHHLYNLSCVEALLGNLEHALEYLEKAIHAGWNNLTHMETDTDLDSLRHLDKYKDIVSSLQKSSLPLQNNICKGFSPFYKWHFLQQQINNHFDIGTPDSLEAVRTLLLHQLSIISNHPVTIYNLACVETLLGDLDSAMHFLEEAIQAGYRDVGHIEKDQDLDGLRHLEKYKVLVASLKNPKTTVDSCPVPPAHPWGDHLKTLQEMGLTDQNKNELVLEMTQGDLTAAIQLLLGEFAHSF